MTITKRQNLEKISQAVKQIRKKQKLAGDQAEEGCFSTEIKKADKVKNKKTKKFNAQTLIF